MKRNSYAISYRYQDFVPRVLIIILLFILVLPYTSLAQKSKKIHKADYDAKKIHFGYFMGVAISNYRIKHNEKFLSSANTEIVSITSPVDYGLKMGGIVNYYVNANFDIRLLPTVAIYSRNISVNEDPEVIPSREQAWFELPVLLRYKSLRRGNMRMNVFMGLRPGFETNAINLAKKSKINRNAGFKTFDLSLEYGAGMEFFRQFFKLAPEIHFSHGLTNILKPADINVAPTSANPLTLLDRINTHTITFYLFFE